MKKSISHCAKFASLILLLPTHGFSQSSATTKLDYVPGEVLVKFKSDVSNFGKQLSLDNEGAEKVKDLNKSGLSQVKIKDDRTVDEMVEAMRSNPLVEDAQPNYIYRTLATPNDPKFSQLWGLKNTGQTITSAGGPDTPRSSNNPGLSGKDMGLASAWDYTTNCSTVVVAVIDSGVNYNHVDLNSAMWNGGVSYPNHGYNFVTSNNDPMDVTGHGTHVAGTIGASGNNGVGTTGVCWQAKIMAVRVFDATGSGTTANMVQGVNFAVTQGAKIINLSAGNSIYDSAFNTAINNARSAGVIIVAAAGNNGTNNESTPMYPCNYTQDNILCVAALDQWYSLASFSNYGSTSVDIGAPGVNIVSEWPGTEATTTDGLTSGWTKSASGVTTWGYKSLTFSSATNCLVSPDVYDHNLFGYANSTDARTWKTFSTSGAGVALLNVNVMWDLENNYDFLKVKARNATGDPIPAGTLITGYTGTSSGGRIANTYDISSAIGSNTTIGFNLTADVSNNNYGVNISDFSIKTLTYNTTTYNVIAGTSMAAPHVAGLAAMVMSYNPSYSYSDVINSIKQGGVSASALSGKTTTGKAVSAIGALSFINTPTGVSVTK